MVFTKFSKPNIRNVVCQFEVVTVLCCIVGITRASVGLKFTPNLISRVVKKIDDNNLKRQHRRLEENKARIQVIELSRISGREYVRIIEGRIKFAPIHMKISGKTILPPEFEYSELYSDEFEPPINLEIFSVFSSKL